MGGSGIKKQFLKNVGSGWIAIGVSALAGFFMLPMNLHYLGKEVYGISALAVSMLTIFNHLSFGMGPTLVRFFSKAIAAKDNDQLKQLSSTAQALLGSLGILGSFLFIGSFNYFLETYKIDIAYRVDLLILFIAMAFSFWENFYLIPFFSLIQGSNRYDLGNTIRIFSIIGRLGILFAGYHYFHPTLRVMAVAIASESAFRLLAVPSLALRCQGTDIIFRPQAINFRLLPGLFSFSAINLMNSFFFNLSIQVPILIIGRTLGLDRVSAFAPAITLSGFLAHLLATISAPLTPLASRDSAHGSANIGRWATHIAQLISCVGFAIVVVFALVGKNVIATWLGSEFEWTNPIVIVMVSGIVVSAVQSTNYSLALGGGTILPISVSSLIMFILTTLGTLLGTVYGGWDLLAVAICITAVRVLRNVFFLAYVYSRLFRYPFVGYFLKVYLYPFVLGVIFYFVFNKFMVRIPIGTNVAYIFTAAAVISLIYFIAAWFFVLNREIKSAVWEIFRKKSRRAS